MTEPLRNLNRRINSFGKKGSCGVVFASSNGVEQGASIFFVEIKNTFHFQKILTGLFVFAHSRVQKMASDAGVPEEWV